MQYPNRVSASIFGPSRHTVAAYHAIPWKNDTVVISYGSSVVGIMLQQYEESLEGSVELLC